MWSMENFIRPMKGNGVTPEGFTGAWAERTALYMLDIEISPAKTWKKIMLAALKIIEKNLKGSASKPASAAKPAWRHQIVDADESS